MPDFIKNYGQEASYKVWWCMELQFGAQNLVSSANFKFWPANYGDGISFGHYDMKFGGKSQNGLK